jgi:hypothetical protein
MRPAKLSVNLLLVTTSSYNILFIFYFILFSSRGFGRKVTILILSSALPRSRGSPGNIVSYYGLDVRTIGVRSPAGAKDFSSNLCVQTGFGAPHPPVQWEPGVLCPGVKRGRDVTLTTYPT